MQALRIQGWSFCTVAIAVSALSLFMGRLEQQTELVVLAFLIIALGVPHGALDTIFARQLYNVKSVRSWLAFVVIYLALAIFVVALWHYAPFWFLLGFLMISATHFSGDLATGTPVFLRVIYGAAIIVLPNLFHSDEIVRIFSFLVNADAARQMGVYLNLLAWPWVLAIAIGIVIEIGKNALTALEIASLGLLATVASPLVAFTVFFCGMHSTRHIMRTLDYSGKSSVGLVIASAFGPMIAILVGATVAWFALRDIPLDARIIQMVFIGLAALTVPHMALVEQVRISGWSKGARST